jgi:hypothetical protein
MQEACCLVMQAIATVLSASGAAELIDLDLRDNPNITPQGQAQLVGGAACRGPHQHTRICSAPARDACCGDKLPGSADWDPRRCMRLCPPS